MEYKYFVLKLHGRLYQLFQNQLFFDANVILVRFVCVRVCKKVFMGASFLLGICSNYCSHATENRIKRLELLSFRGKTFPVNFEQFTTYHGNAWPLRQYRAEGARRFDGKSARMDNVSQIVSPPEWK